MKLLAAIFALLLLAGCGAIEIYSDGKVVAREASLLKGVQFQRFATTSPTVATSIEGGSGMIDDAAIEKIVEGVVAGLVKGAK